MDDKQDDYFTRILTISLFIFSFNYVEGQGGAGPVGSIADYYDQSFGNPFLGYWKNPGNKYPYGSHSIYTDFGGLGPAGSDGAMGGRGTPYGSPLYNGMDRPQPGVPSYLYDRIGPEAAYGYAGPYGIGMPGMGMPVPGYGGGMYGGGGLYPGGGMNYLPGGGGGGFGMMGAGGRTPADRGLQDLLPSSYAYKPWYP